MREYRWVLRPVKDEVSVHRLRQELNDVPEALARALVLRNIDTFERARLFFRPDIDHLFDPFLMCDMHPAADRVIQAIRKNERVLVYGDYDVDGVTATALMLSFLRSQGVEARYFIPDRFEDGYGLGGVGIDMAVDYGAELIIALDCGITGHDAADYARQCGLDLVICDHHTVGDTIPDAVAVLDPKRPDCSYPFKDLSGCGVGFKLVQAVLAKLGRPVEDAFAYLDLVALSIASDIVPILGENRVLMIEGLRRIKKHARLGLRKLAECARLDLVQCSTSQIVFGLGPRINAAGRLGNARRAVDLLIADEEAAATQLAAQLEEINIQRRALDKETLDHAVQLAESSFSTTTRNAIVLYERDWHLGVIGIVASRLVDRFYRPTILLCSSNGEAKGSARSIAGVNVYEALRACQSLLTRFGGHKYAAGMTLPEENIEAFTDRFNDVVTASVSPELLLPEIAVDAELHLSDITPRFWNILRQFAPFGPENKSPVFHARGLRVIGRPTIVGHGGHLKFKVAQQDAESFAPFDVIGFGLHEHLPTVRSSHETGVPLEMLFSIDKNSWNGQTTLQLRAKDLRLGVAESPSETSGARDAEADVPAALSAGD